MTQVVAALIWDKDRFLACQRPAHKARGLLWEFVGGKVEPGESKEDALVRECREELAITVKPVSVFMTLVHEYPDLTVELTLYNAVIDAGVPQMLEHNDIRWITTKEIDAYDFCPADEEILLQLKKLDSALQAELYALSDPQYKSFQSKLMPSVDSERVLGVRMPDIRRLAKQLTAQGDNNAFLEALPHKYYEEDNIHGLLICGNKNFRETVELLNNFLPYVNNWATCDLLSPIAFRARPAELTGCIRNWLKSSHPYTVRFAIGMLMKFYLEEGFSKEYLTWVASVRSEEYYVKMMQAWYLATALAKQYHAVVSVLENRVLEPWTHNKTIQKAVESYRIPPERKGYLRTLRLKQEV